MIKNIWFIGTGQFAALCLEGMRKYDIPVSKIITGLPTRSGRNNKENPSAVEFKAKQLGFDVTRTGKLSENKELISGKLFIDYLLSLKRNAIKKKVAKNTGGHF